MKTLVVSILLAGMVSAQAGIYRWVDAEGNVVYSQAPPPSAKEEIEEIKLPSSVRSFGAENTTKDAERKIKQTDQATDSAGKKKKIDSALKKQYCEKAMKNLKLLKDAEPDAAFVTEDNELVRFSEEEKAERIRRAEESRKFYCVGEEE